MHKNAKTQIISALIDRDGYKCMFPGCTKPFTKDDPPTIDHWYPKSIFHDESLENLRLMHCQCNNLKGDTVPELCTECKSDRIESDKNCAQCQKKHTKKFSAAYRRKPKSCTHSGKYSCWMCIVGFVQRIAE